MLSYKDLINCKCRELQDHDIKSIVKGRTILAADSGDSCEFGSPKFFLLCMLGGIISCGSTHTLVTPLDIVKCRLQVDKEKYIGLIPGLKITKAEGGLKALYKGWAPTMIGYGLQGCFKFGLYEFFKIQYADLIGEKANEYRSIVYLCASASAEFIADIFLCPLESIKVKIQTTECYADTLREAAPKMYAEEGMHAFYKSLVPLWCRQIPYTMMKFTCFEKTVDLLYTHVVPKPRSECSKAEQLVVTFAAGYIAGVFCAIVSHPADTVVSKMSKEKDKTAFEVAKKLGWSGLWGGLGVRIVMIGTLTALQWFIYDGFKVTMGVPRPPPH